MKAGEPGGAAPDAGGSSDGASANSDIFGSGDGFDQGWFHDRSAIPQVIAWAAVCAAIAVSAYQLAKWRRNSLIGIAAGVVPLLVGLYFFYENVNRLLPAAL